MDGTGFSKARYGRSGTNVASQWKGHMSSGKWSWCARMPRAALWRRSHSKPPLLVVKPMCTKMSLPNRITSAASNTGQAGASSDEASSNEASVPRSVDRCDVVPCRADICNGKSTPSRQGAGRG